MLTKTISEALCQLESTLREAEETQNPLGMFAALQYWILLEVQEGVKSERFEHPQQMEIVETIMVTRFLEAYSAYQAGGNCSHSWQATFDTCLQRKLVLLQHFYMGINAQINLDLGIAAAQIAPGNELYKLEKDLQEFHGIVEQVLTEAQRRLKVISPLSWLLDLPFYKKRRFIQFNLRAAQKHSWTTAELLSNLSGSRLCKAVEQIDNFVVKLNNLILKPSWFISLILGLILFLEKQDADRIIHLLRK